IGITAAATNPRGRAATVTHGTNGCLVHRNEVHGDDNQADQDHAEHDEKHDLGGKAVGLPGFAGTRIPAMESHAPRWTIPRRAPADTTVGRRGVGGSSVTPMARGGSSAPRPPGRPSKLAHDVAWRLIALIVSGVPIAHAAADVGVDRRSIERWRRRAYSSRPEDQLCVELEQGLQRGLLAAAEVGQRRVTLEPLDVLLANFDEAT